MYYYCWLLRCFTNYKQMRAAKLIVGILLGILMLQLKAGAVATASETGVFTDSKRGRDVPYKIYYPKDLKGAYPIVIFSHGLGGSKEGYEYLGRFLAQNGYLCIHIQHAGSDEEVWKGKTSKAAIMASLRKAVSKPMTAVNRFKDIPFVVDMVEDMNSSSPIFKGHIDLGKIGIAGHSFGAYTVLAASGQQFGRGWVDFKESRIKAGVALSPNPPKGTKVGDTKIYDGITIPLMHFTGTDDYDQVTSSDGDFDPKTRTIPYQNINRAPQYLVVLDKATHMTFSGSERSEASDPKLDQHLTSVQQGVLAFFDMYLKGDRKQGDWLQNGGYLKTLSSLDRFEWKK